MFILFSLFLFLQTPVEKPKENFVEIKKEEEIPLKEFTDLVKTLEIYVDRIDKPETYKDFEWTFVDIKLKYDNLSEIHQGVFLLGRYQEASVNFIIIRDKWQKYIFSQILQNPKDSKNKELVDCINKITFLQKQLAKKHKDFADKFFDKNSASFTPREIVYYKKNMQLVGKKFGLLEESK